MQVTDLPRSPETALGGSGRWQGLGTGGGEARRGEARHPDLYVFDPW